MRVSGTGVTVDGIPGAATSSRYAGATASGHPTTGTFLTGDAVIDLTGTWWICTAGGSPGTWVSSSASTATSTMTVRLPFSYSVSGLITVPSGATGYLPPFYVPVPTGQTVTLQYVEYSVRGGTSVTFDLQHNGAGITSFTGLSATTTPTTSAQINVSLAAGDTLAPVVTAISGTPDGLVVTFWVDFTVTVSTRANAQFPLSDYTQIALGGLFPWGGGAAEISLGEPGDTQPRVELLNTGYVVFGPGGATSPDTGIQRSDVGVLAVTNAMTVWGLAGAAAAPSRWVGATASGAPTTGTFATGDFVVSNNGHVYICTAGGSPGTWVDAGAAASTPAVSTHTAAYTATASDGTVLANGTFTVTLPPVVSGQTLTVKNIGTGTITVAPQSGTIDGLTTDTLPAQYMARTYQSDGTNWFIV